jgi:hypothetical protein
VATPASAQESLVTRPLAAGQLHNIQQVGRAVLEARRSDESESVESDAVLGQVRALANAIDQALRVHTPSVRVQDGSQLRRLAAPDPAIADSDASITRELAALRARAQASTPRGRSAARAGLDSRALIDKIAALEAATRVAQLAPHTERYRLLAEIRGRLAVETLRDRAQAIGRATTADGAASRVTRPVPTSALIGGASNPIRVRRVDPPSAGDTRQPAAESPAITTLAQHR